MTDYERMTTFEALYRAHMRARKGHRHKNEIIRFESRLSENLLALQAKLMDLSKLKIQYFKFKVYEPKERNIAATRYETRVMMHALCDEVLCPVFDNIFFHENMACQKGKGNHAALKLLTSYCYELSRECGNDFYFLKCDIRKFFESIDHEILKRLLRRVFDDKSVLALCDLIIDSVEGGKGLPLGNQTSQQFGIFYAQTIDHLVLKELGLAHYLRYSDDMVVCHPDRAVLESTLVQIRERLSLLGLELNESKTEIVKASRGVSFLGFRYVVTRSNKILRSLRLDAKKRLKTKVSKLKNDYYLWKIDGDDIAQSYASFHGHLKHGHTWKLQQQLLYSVRFRRGGKDVSGSFL